MKRRDWMKYVTGAGAAGVAHAMLTTVDSRGTASAQEAAEPPRRPDKQHVVEFVKVPFVEKELIQAVVPRRQHLRCLR